MGRPKGSKNKKQRTHCKLGHLVENGRCSTCDKVSKEKYYQKHKESFIERAAMWSKTHPEEFEKAQRKSRNNHKENIKAYLRGWRHSNPEAVMAQQNKRRTLRTHAGGFFTLYEWFTLCFAFGFRCACCKKNKPLPVDHVIPVSKGGPSWLWNIQPLCRSCNSKKNDKIIDYRV